jgi:hypothetical protein
MAKRKAGLHKKVTSIFDGVPLGDKKADPQGPVTKAPHRKPKNIPNPAAVQRPSIPDTAPAAKMPVPDYSNQAKPQQTQQKIPQTPKPEKPRVAPAIKSASNGSWQQTLDKLTNKLAGNSTPRQKVMLLLVPVLFIVLIVVFVKVLAPPVSGSRLANTLDPTNTVAAASTDIDWNIPEPYPATLRDPMKKAKPVSIVKDPQPKPQNTNSEFIVKGTLWDNENPLAIINGQPLGVGEEIDGATIVKINTDSVVFEKDGKKWTQPVQ